MAGYPYAGKSLVVQMLTIALRKHSYPYDLIDPKELRDETYTNLNEEDKRDMNIAAWEISLEMLAEKISAPQNKLLIYDTACASYRGMEPLFKLACQKHHRVVYAFVDASLDLCKLRAGSEWLSNDVIEKYQVNFAESIEKLINWSSDYFIIKNNVQGSLPDISKLVRLFGFW
jgi:predicted kinase